MKKNHDFYILPIQNIALYFKKNKFLVFVLNTNENTPVMYNISNLEAAKLIVFEYREENNWCEDPLFNTKSIYNLFETDRINDSNIYYLKDVIKIVGEDIMREAILWSNSILKQYLETSKEHLNDRKEYIKTLFLSEPVSENPINKFMKKIKLLSGKNKKN
jgi:hypothetical protein